MYNKSKIILSLLIFFSLKSPGWAWVRHNLITHYILSDQSWLERYNNLRVTPYSYQDNSLNPKFEILYTNPSQDTPPPGEFRYYALQNQEKPGFIGTPVGGQISAKQILGDFSDEPDWRMDAGLDLAIAQKLMAGSRGYRHMYYPAWDWHLPLLFIPQGAPHQRAEHFYQLARQAFRQGDAYWGFRFLARTLHYLQDMGQPYHTTQTSLKFITWSSPVAGTTQATKNYHFAYESYISYRLECENNGLMPPNYSLALAKAQPLKLEGVSRGVVQVAEINNKTTQATFQTSVEFFGANLRSAQEIPLTQADAERLNTAPQRPAFDEQVRQALELTSAATKGFLEYMRQDLGDILL